MMGVFPVSGPASVRVEVQMGRVEVVAEPRDDVSVAVEPANPRRSGDRNAAEAVRVVAHRRRHQRRRAVPPQPLRPGRLRRCRRAGARGIRCIRESQVRLGAARGTLGTARLALDYGDASIEQAGRADLGLGHGELRVEHISGDADVTLKSGRARIGTVGGALRLKGSDAGIDVGTVAGAADIATSTGVVQLGDPGPALTVRSAYGPVRISELVQRRRPHRGVVRRPFARRAVGHGRVARRVEPARRRPQRAHRRRRTRRRRGIPRTAARTGYGDITVHRAPAGAAAPG